MRCWLWARAAAPHLYVRVAAWVALAICDYALPAVWAYGGLYLLAGVARC